MPARMIFFDAVGTLIIPTPSPAQVYADFGQQYGSQLSADEIAPRFKAAFQSEEAIDRNLLGWATSEERELARWRSIVGAVFAEIEPRAGERLFTALFAHYGTPAAWRVLPQLEPLIAEFDARGIRWSIASNFDRRLRSVQAGHRQLAACASLCISSEVGSRKPAAAFFHHCQALFGLEPGDCCLIGDDRENDFAGATAAGWESILIEPATDFAGLQRRVLDWAREA